MASYNFSNSNDYALSGYYACLGHGSGFAGIGGDQQIAFCTHSGVGRCTHSCTHIVVHTVVWGGVHIVWVPHHCSLCLADWELERSDQIILDQQNMISSCCNRANILIQ